jgi:hypothetical protein
MKRYFKVEGNIIYPDDTMLTWGPFYYHNPDNGKEKMNGILQDIVNWCNLQDPTLNIQPENLIQVSGNTQIVFSIKAWKDEKTLETCNGIIEIEDIFFED